MLNLMNKKCLDGMVRMILNIVAAGSGIRRLPVSGWIYILSFSVSWIKFSRNIHFRNGCFATSSR